MVKHRVLRWASTEQCSGVKSVNTRNVHVEGLKRRCTQVRMLIKCGSGDMIISDEPSLEESSRIKPIQTRRA
jgi:hypothetical protein